jgi:hypothetical protein
MGKLSGTGMHPVWPWEDAGFTFEHEEVTALKKHCGSVECSPFRKKNTFQCRCECDGCQDAKRNA